MKVERSCEEEAEVAWFPKPIDRGLACCAGEDGMKPGFSSLKVCTACKKRKLISFALKEITVLH